MIRPAALKLAQASRRLRELEQATNDFIKRDPFSIGWELSEDRRDHSIHLHVRATPPDHHLGPLIGEVIHNTGSALDAIAWEIATATAHADAQPPHTVRFPVVSTDTPTSRRELAKLLRPFSGIPEARELIEFVQPREDNGCYELVLLEALWNFDKHRGLHRTVPMQLHGDGGSASIFTSMPLDQEAPLIVPAAGGTSATPKPAGWQPSWPTEDQWSLAFAPPLGTTIFDSPSYVGGPVIGTLRNIHAAVRSRIVEPLGRILDA